MENKLNVKTKSWKIGNMFIFWEPPNIVCENSCWLIIMSGYMYGPYKNLFSCFRDMIFEYKHAKNSIG